MFNMKTPNLINIFDPIDIKKNYFAYKCFLKFLIQNNALHNFLDELYQENNPYRCYFGRLKIKDAIDDSFVWVESRLGDEYWSRLYDKYCNIIYELFKLKKLK